MSKHKTHSRRDFLNLFGYATSIPLFQGPAQILIESILGSVVNKAHAAELGVNNPRRFLQIVQEGAPTKHMYDLLLKPYGGSFVPNIQTGTKYVGNTVSYSTILRKGLNVPHMWQFNVPHRNGSTRPLEDLLDNYLGLRGINIGNPDHSAAQAMQFVPLAAAQSMPALAADISSAPIPAVNAGLGQYKFKSLNSKSAVTMSNYGNMVKSLMTPFVRKAGATFTLERADMATALDSTLSALNSMSESIHPDARAIASATKSAKDLLRQGFGDLEKVWTDLTTKYTSLVTRALSPSQSLPGINDHAILSDGSVRFSADSNLIPLANNFDVRTIIQTTTGIDRLITHFALAEYILTNNLSYSVSIAPGWFNNLKVNSDTAARLSFDEHQTGGAVALLMNTYYNLALSSCLLELIDQLKIKNIFNETVIVMGGEFGRNPRNDGSGSDHGYTGGHSTIISGAITSPMVLGNIYATDPISSSIYKGTWGQAAPVAELGKELDTGHWASTVATLLRTPTPVTASPSLLIEKDGIYTPFVEKAKQV